MTAELVSKRFSNMRRVLSEEGLDAIAITNYSPSCSTLYFDYNMTYLSNLSRTFPNSFFVLTKDGYYACVDSFDVREVERAEKDAWVTVAGGRIVGSTPETFAKMAVDAVRERTAAGRPRIGVNGRKVNLVVASALARSADVVDAAVAIERARIVKDADEIAWMTKACQIAEAGFQTMLSGVREGIMERELAAMAEYEMTQRGADYFWAGLTMVMTGPDAVCTLGTDSSTDRKIAKGHLVHVDIFPSCHGYMADMARTMVTGQPTKEQRELIEVNYRAFEGAIGALKAGNKVGQIKEAAFRDVPAKYQGLVLGPGHGIGLNDDLIPYLGRASDADRVLEDGMAISIEIATMIPGVGGVRYEDNFVVRGADPLRLSKAEKLVVVEL
jgi:Xaa-Pro aminopeptidase